MMKSWFEFENLDVILIDSWIKYFQLLDIHVFVIYSPDIQCSDVY